MTRSSGLSEDEMRSLGSLVGEDLSSQSDLQSVNTFDSDEPVDDNADESSDEWLMNDSYWYMNLDILFQWNGDQVEIKVFFLLQLN